MTPILETKALHDAKASIADGMASLMKRMVRETQTPAQREAADYEAARKLRDQALVVFLNRPAARLWWVWGDLFCAWDAAVFFNTCRTVREVYDGSDVFERLVGHDPDTFQMFREMDAPHRAAYLAKMRAAELPPTVHPMQLSDPATGEFSHVAA